MAATVHPNQRNTAVMSRLKGMFGGQAKHINIDNSVMAPPMSAAAFTAASDSEDSARTSSSDGEYEAAAAPTSAPASRSNSHSTIASALASASAPAAATKKSQAAVARSNSKSKGPASPLLNPVVSNKSSTSLNLQCQRVHMLDDQGHHEHVLRSVSRRQEKLRNMFGELMGNGKKVRDDAVSAMPELLSAPATPQAAPDLSLISGFVRRVEAGKLDPSAVLGKPAPTNAAPVTGLAKSASSASLLEKYGKCQGVIGRGAYGVVRITQKFDHKSRCEKLFAIKEFKRKSEEDPKNFANRLASEFCISSSLHHVNIIQTLDLMKDFKGECCQVMEYCEGGDLYSLILASEGGLTALEADCFFKQICRGVVYIHSMGVAHCDLKPENILLTKNGCVKITDFGNGECFRMAWEKEIHMSTGVCGSRPYIAPEQFRDAEFDPRPVDIWAIGVIYMAMRTGSYLWQIAVPDEDKYYREYLQGRKHQNGYRPIEQLPRSRCRNVIYSILDPYPNRRITGKQILNSEWGRSIVVCDAGEKATE